MHTTLQFIFFYLNFIPMKNFLLHAIVLLILCPSAVDAQDLKAELQGLAQSFQEANNRGDAEALNNLYTDEVVMVNPQDGSKTTITRAQIKEQDILNFSLRVDVMNIVVDSAESQPDGKVKVKGSVTGMWTDKNTGAKTNYTGSYEHLVVKEGGQWKLCELKFLP